MLQWSLRVNDPVAPRGLMLQWSLRVNDPVAPRGLMLQWSLRVNIQWSPRINIARTWFWIRNIFLQNFWKRDKCFARWKQCVNGWISVGRQWNKNLIAVSRKQHEQRKMLNMLLSSSVPRKISRVWVKACIKLLRHCNQPEICPSYCEGLELVSISPCSGPSHFWCNQCKVTSVLQMAAEMSHHEGH